MTTVAQGSVVVRPPANTPPGSVITRTNDAPGSVLVRTPGPAGPQGPPGTSGGIDRPTAQGIALVQALIFGG